jgi:putative glycosyltransferase (TIGR04372 family)
MGLKAEKKVKIDNKLFFDLPFMNINYDYFNFFLIKNCKFFVGTQSGILDTAFLFNKDCLITNIVRVFETPPYTKKSRAICKIPFVKQNRKLLNLNKYLDLSYSAHHEYFINNKYDFKENTSKELLDAIKNFLKSFNKKNFTKKNYKSNELIFKSYLINRFAEMYHNDLFLINHNQKSKLFKILLSSKGVYMSSFLKKYFIEPKK